MQRRFRRGPLVRHWRGWRKGSLTTARMERPHSYFKKYEWGVGGECISVDGEVFGAIRAWGCGWRKLIRRAWNQKILGAGNIA